MATFDESFWHNYAYAYSDLFELHPVRDALEAVIRVGRLRQGSRILDVGSGPGFLLRSLDQPGRRILNLRARRPEVTELDSSPEMLERARRVPYRGQVNFCRADFDQLTAGSGLTGLYDRLVLNNSLYAAADPAGTLRELCAWATTDAILVVSTPKSDPQMSAILDEHLRLAAQAGLDPANERKRILNLLGPVVEINRRILAHQNFHYPNREQLLAWFVESGWKITSLTTTYAGQNWLVVAERR